MIDLHFTSRQTTSGTDTGESVKDEVEVEVGAEAAVVAGAAVVDAVTVVAKAEAAAMAGSTTEVAATVKGDETIMQFVSI